MVARIRGHGQVPCRALQDDCERTRSPARSSRHLRLLCFPQTGIASPTAIVLNKQRLIHQEGAEFGRGLGGCVGPGNLEQSLGWWGEEDWGLADPPWRTDVLSHDCKRSLSAAVNNKIRGPVGLAIISFFLYLYICVYIYIYIYVTVLFVYTLVPRLVGRIIASHRSHMASPGFGETTIDCYLTLPTGHEASVSCSGT